MDTRSARLREVGFDALDALGAANHAAALRAAELSFAMIYVERATPAIVWSLLQQRVDVCFLSEARVSGWSAETGSQDGKAAAEKMLALGVPATVSLGCDMEAGVPDEAAAVAYANGWYGAARAVGLGPDAPDLYVGSGSGFASPATLFHKLGFKRYHRSLSIVPNVDERDYCCIQLFPGNQQVAGVEVDFDVMQQDKLGGLLNLLTL